MEVLSQRTKFYSTGFHFFTRSKRAKKLRIILYRSMIALILFLLSFYKRKLKTIKNANLGIDLSDADED
jgi:hypothetical protein